jgi:SecD/SecF fusion protein
MQNKGAIRLLAIALALVCLYQLSFTIVTSRVQSKAEKYAQEKVDQLSLQSVPQERLQVYKDSLKKRFESAYLDSMSGEVVYNFIGLRKYTYKECKGREINLGLDLKGGMNVTLEVSVEDIIKSLANHSTDTTFNQALQLAKKCRKTVRKII